MQWAPQVAMDAEFGFAAAVMDAINGFNELEREAMHVVIVPDKHLHRILSLYDIMYTGRDGELWYFDEDCNLCHTLSSRTSMRQECVLVVFVFRLTIAPIYWSQSSSSLERKVCWARSLMTCTCTSPGQGCPRDLYIAYCVQEGGPLDRLVTQEVRARDSAG
jgi:hypothetical protein